MQAPSPPHDTDARLGLCRDRRDTHPREEGSRRKRHPTPAVATPRGGGRRPGAGGKEKRSLSPQPPSPSPHSRTEDDSPAWARGEGASAALPPAPAGSGGPALRDTSREAATAAAGKRPERTTRPTPALPPSQRPTPPPLPRLLCSALLPSLRLPPPRLTVPPALWIGRRRALAHPTGGGGAGRGAATHGGPPPLPPPPRGMTGLVVPPPCPGRGELRCVRTPVRVSVGGVSTGMYAHICVYSHIYTCVRIYVYVHIGVCGSVCIVLCVHICICVYVCICIDVCVYTHVYAYMYVYMYVHMYVSMHVHIFACVYVCMHTQTCINMHVCLYNTCMYICTYCIYGGGPTIRRRGSLPSVSPAPASKTQTAALHPPERGSAVLGAGDRWGCASGLQAHPRGRDAASALPSSSKSWFSKHLCTFMDLGPGPQVLAVQRCGGMLGIDGGAAVPTSWDPAPAAAATHMFKAWEPRVTCRI